MMSASARKLIPTKLVVAFAGLLLVGALVVPARAQSDSVPSASVVAMVARLRAASAHESEYADAIALGQKLLVARRYAEADEVFKAFLDKWPHEPAALYGAALAAFNLGRAAEAEPLARAAAEALNKNANANDSANGNATSRSQRLLSADALVLLAVVQGARGDDAEALKSVRRAVVLAPEHFDAQFTLGRALYGVGDSAGAAKAFRDALRLRPDDSRALFFLATALENAGDTKAALIAYRDLVRQQPRAAEGHLGLGVLLIKRGGADADKGIDELRTAVRIDPNQYEAQVTLGRALLTQKFVAESIQHLNRAAELAPSNPEPHYQLALAYRRLGMNDKAVAETAIVQRIHESRRGEGAQNKTAIPEQ
jgi:tetratricopeptide (TPR) repeat protein